MTTRQLVVVVVLTLLAGAAIGSLGYGWWDTRRDARIEREIRTELAEVEREREELRQRAVEAERERGEMERQLQADSVAREEERAHLRRMADIARARTDSLAEYIVVTFPETEEVINELQERHREEMAVVERERDVALEEVESLREARVEDAEFISLLQVQVRTADENLDAAVRARVAAEQAAASREQWYKWGGGGLTLLIITLALIS